MSRARPESGLAAMDMSLPMMKRSAAWYPAAYSDAREMRLCPWCEQIRSAMATSSQTSAGSTASSSRTVKMESSNPLQISFEDLSYSVRVPAKPQAADTEARPQLLHPLKALGSLLAATKYEDKPILTNLNGTFQPGRLTAILGPSGSGKTTLLNLLAGQLTQGTSSGHIWVNGRPATGPSLRQLAAYVNQDDVILATQTVQEAIEMSTVLRPAPSSSAQASAGGAAVNETTDEGQLPLPATAPKETRAKNASDSKEKQRLLWSRAISLFELDKCKDTIIGDSTDKGVSGGERKRTAIAMEWVTQASILFLDEPTSGLDAHSALVVTHHLKEIAQTGRTVVTVLHQPSSEMFEMIDDVLILCEGRIVYLGERASLVGYLSKLGYPCGLYTNPADHIFNAVLFERGSPILSGKDVQLSQASHATHTGHELDASSSHVNQRALRLLHAWKFSQEASIVQSRIDQPELSPIQEAQLRRVSPPMVQIRYLMKRAAKNALRNKLVLRIRIGQSIGFGLILGLVFLNTQNRPASVQMQNFSGAIFFTCVTQYLLTTLAVVNVFAGERMVFLREWQAGYYTLPSYFIAKNIVELPIQIVSPILYACISYWLLGFRRDGARFLLYMVVCIVLSLCGFSCGILLGSSFESLSTILAVLPAIFLPLLLFGGLLVNTGNSTAWLRWLQWVSPIKYGYTAMAKNQFSGYVVNGQPVGDSYLDVIQLGPFSVGINILFVAAISFIIWATAYLALARLTHRGRVEFGNGSRRKIQADLLGPPDPRFTAPQR
ncbi:hypothetical protein GQ54DRAFT_332885 [Martensiomyces pterosporus]|nr:hypothetical protein GQ54DRAFT_332885 [Martensiomyces pterosporus]